MSYVFIFGFYAIVMQASDGLYLYVMNVSSNNKHQSNQNINAQIVIHVLFFAGI